MGLLENYKAAGSKYEGKSLNKWDPISKKWEQFWIDNSGLTLRLAGEHNDGKMVMGNETNQITWSMGENDTVRQVWKTKKDGKWLTAFDGTYVRKRE